jgi:hypothetical protein
MSKGYHAIEVEPLPSPAPNIAIFHRFQLVPVAPNLEID